MKNVNYITLHFHLRKNYEIKNFLCYNEYATYFVPLFWLPIANKNLIMIKYAYITQLLELRCHRFPSSAGILSFYKASNIFHHIYFSLNIKIQ